MRPKGRLVLRQPQFMSVRCQRPMALDSRKDKVTVIWCYLCILQHQGCAQPQAKLKASLSSAGFTLSWDTSSLPQPSSRTIHLPQCTLVPSTQPLSTHSPTGPSLTYMSCLPAPLLTPAPNPTLAPALPPPCTDPYIHPTPTTLIPCSLNQPQHSQAQPSHQT